MGMNTDSSFTWTPKKLSGLDKLNVIVVGGTGGLGRAVTYQLASAGARVTVIGQTFRDENTANVSFVKGDLSSMVKARELAASLDVSNVDIVLLTAGIFAGPKREETAEGLEKDLAVSFLNRKVIVDVIAPKLKNSQNSSGFTPRIFNMAYPGNDQLGNIDDLNSEKGYGTMKAHMTTVAGNEALIYDSVAKYPGVHFYGLNPGIVKTNIRNNLLGEGSWKSGILETIVGWFTRTPEQYAATIAPLLIAPELEQQNGGSFNNNGKLLLRSKGMTNEYAGEFMRASEDLLARKGLAEKSSL